MFAGPLPSLPSLPFPPSPRVAYGLPSLGTHPEPILWFTSGTSSGSIPQHLENIPDLQRFTVWGNNAMTRRYTTQEVEGDNLGTILSVEVYESQARRRPLPDLKFF